MHVETILPDFGGAPIFSAGEAMILEKGPREDMMYMCTIYNAMYMYIAA